MTDRERAESAYKDYPYNNVPRVQKDVFIEAFVMGMEAERNREWERIRETRDNIKDYYGG